MLLRVHTDHCDFVLAFVEVVITDLDLVPWLQGSRTHLGEVSVWFI